MMKQFNGHIAGPDTMSGFVNLSEPSRVDNLPALQTGLINHWNRTSGRRHSSLQEEMNKGDDNYYNSVVTASPIRLIF